MDRQKERNTGTQTDRQTDRKTADREQGKHADN